MRTRVIPLLDNTIAELQASVRTKDEEIAELKRQLQTVITESGQQVLLLCHLLSRLVVICPSHAPRRVVACMCIVVNDSLSFFCTRAHTHTRTHWTD